MRLAARFPLTLGLALAIAGCGAHPREAREAPAPHHGAGADSAAPPAPSTAAQPGFDYGTRVGIADWDPSNHLHLSIPDTTLASGDPVTLVWLANPQSISEARITTRTTQEWKLGGAKAEGPAYDLELVTAGEEVGWAIAIPGRWHGARLEEGKVRLDLDGDGTAEVFRDCASDEGAHLTVWSGPPPAGTRRWHRYVYLGYDVEANCTEEEARDSTP
jgi:hypothetical protein